MVEQRHIAKWLNEGLITNEQAEQMRSNVKEDRQERTSNRLITAMATIGAVLFGLGAVLFVASNWQVLSDPVKVMILLGSTFGVSYLGYLFAYEKQNLPKVGSALLFLGCLLFGASIFLIGQIYHVQAHSHALVFVWLIGIIPVVYALRSMPVAALSIILLFLWIGLFIFRGTMANINDWIGMPALYLVSGILVFETGGLHYFFEDFKAVARTYRLAAIKVVMLSLFLLTFRIFAGHYEFWNFRSEYLLSPHMKEGIIVVGLIALGMSIWNMFTNPSESETIGIEGITSISLIGLTLIFVLFPAPTNIYVVVFNLAMAACIGLLISIGYKREDIQLVNIGLGSLVLLVFVRYCDFFWGLLSRSMFFLVGGIVLILGGIALEQKRRQLKMRFSQ